MTSVLEKIIESNNPILIIISLILLIAAIFFLAASIGILIQGNASEPIDKQKARKYAGLLLLLSIAFLSVNFFTSSKQKKTSKEECQIVIELKETNKTIENKLKENNISNPQMTIFRTFFNQFNSYIDDENLCQDDLKIEKTKQEISYINKLISKSTQKK